jgi:hypothetical protein
MPLECTVLGPALSLILVALRSRNNKEKRV